MFGYLILLNLIKIVLSTNSENKQINILLNKVEIIVNSINLNNYNNLNILVEELKNDNLFTKINDYFLEIDNIIVSDDYIIINFLDILEYDNIKNYSNKVMLTYINKFKTLFYNINILLFDINNQFWEAITPDFIAEINKLITDIGKYISLKNIKIYDK